MNIVSRGSIWRKWDLQVQTILDDGYISIGSYFDELKKAHPDKCKSLVEKIGSEDLVKRYDSKEYFFTDKTEDSKTRARNYAKLFLSFQDLFNENVGGVCITDHNYDHEFLVDCLLKECENTDTKIIPGVEINVQGVHYLILFGKLCYGKLTYSDSIKTFLTKIDVINKKTNNSLSVCPKSYEDVINETRKIGAIVICPHCNSSNGLFQERGKTDRTQLADQFNYQSFNILQSKNKKSVEVTVAFINDRQTLKSECVFTLGSDARSLKDVFMSDEDGNYCWIKADPTFEGLRQIVFEPTRAYIGSEPPILDRVRQNPTKFIESVSITQIEGYQENDGVWFKDISIPLNSEMVAIIGNKGGGKSAIADIIGYVGGAKTVIETNGASFLNEDKFRKNDLARNFAAILKWNSNDTDGENLFSPKNLHTSEKVKYLPQHWFEELCNDLDGKKFNEELEKVVFSHLDSSERIGHSSFAELVRDKSQSANQEIAKFKTQLTTINTSIVELLEKLHPDYKNELGEAVKQKQRELDAHNKLKPTKVRKPVDDNPTTKALADQIAQLNSQITNFELTQEASVAFLTTIKQKHQNLINFVADLLLIKKEIDELTEKYDLNEITGETLEQPLFSFTYDENKIEEVKKKLSDTIFAEELKHYSLVKINQIENLTPQQKTDLLKISILAQLETAKNDLVDLKKQLGKPQEKYQKYLEDKKKWDNDKLKIEGDVDNPVDGTLNYLKKQVAALNKDIPDQLKEKEQLRKDISELIFNKKHEIISIYESIKRQVDVVLQQGKQSIDGYSISVDAGFRLSPKFVDETIGHINLRAKGSFMETDNARVQIKKLSEQNNLQTFEEVNALNQGILDNLVTDNRQEVDGNKRQRYLQDQIKSPVEFLDYLYGLEFLTTNYQLKLDQKTLENLSPGEKGALLLVFYLMLDQDDIPLVIDQPEDNLDNESVAKILVEFIKSAKHRRQIIMVTHNPNLAVVADAEQVIYVNIDKANKNTFSYISGSIENDEVNKKIVDVLEGTMPAFDKRRLRYFKHNN